MRFPANVQASAVRIGAEGNSNSFVSSFIPPDDPSAGRATTIKIYHLERL
jgi:hypothetical protein